MRRIVEADHLPYMLRYLAGDAIYNLKSIVISENNSLSTPGHCFMLLIMPGMVISSHSINLVTNNCNCVENR